jgi:uncharacterized protein (DUF58 family)
LKSRTPEQILNRIDWIVLRRLEGLHQGEYRTLFRGDGLDLADLREYQPNDDVRHIDWNVTARLQTPYVRILHEDRELTAWFLVDLSASLDAGWTETRKRDVAIDFTAVLARILTRRGNKAGAILFGSGPNQVHPPSNGRDHLLHLVQRMQRAPENQSHDQTDLSSALASAARVIRRRSLIFIISDFVSKPGWEEPLGRLSVNHEVVACRIVDPLEQELQNVGIVVMEDAETGEQVMIDTGRRSVRRAYAQHTAETDEAIMDGLAQAGVDCLEIGTQDDLITGVLRFSRMRRERGLAASPKEIS